ncbi:A-agglutinin anchorage subunit-like [Cornus florida]|uniref:A-agglutinin anchorage subunit-like n=1 Tax=Cornus florida TaxID=4283 RepID=UPI00289A42B9|nr:A-agglutinin anchorage subunit-like [Cornus florida]
MSIASERTPSDHPNTTKNSRKTPCTRPYAPPQGSATFFIKPRAATSPGVSVTRSATSSDTSSTTPSATSASAASTATSAPYHQHSATSTSQSMRSFLKGRKLWSYVTGDRTTLTQAIKETSYAYVTRVEDWDSNNDHKIIIWLRNTSNSSIGIEFGSYETAKEIWDMLVSRYSGSDGARQFQLMLLHRSPFPSLDQALNELVREETGLQNHRSQNHITILAKPSSTPHQSGSNGRNNNNRSGSQQSNNKKDLSGLYCTFCRIPGHSIDFCCIRVRLSTTTVANTEYLSPPFSTPVNISSGESTSASFVFSTTDLEAVLNQVLSRYQGASSTALSTIPSKYSSWYFDSACCNHMTPDSTFLTSQTSPSCSPVIHTADGSTMTISHIGTISQSQLSVLHVYLVPNLSLNLLSIGQLTELGLTITFSSNGCVVGTDHWDRL